MNPLHLKSFIFILMALLSLVCNAQTEKDSLWSVWNDESEVDTNRFNAMSKLIWDHYLFRDPDTAFVMSQSLYDAAKLVNNEKSMHRAMNQQGISYHLRGQMENALEQYDKVLEFAEKRGNRIDMAGAWNGMGNVYWAQGDFAQALELYTRALDTTISIGDSSNMAASVLNVGLIKSEMGDMDEALKYYERAYELSLQFDQKRLIATSLNNLAVIYKQQGLLDKAIEKFTLVLRLSEEMDDKRNTALALNNIGGIYADQNEEQKALEYYERAKEIEKEMGSKRGYAKSLLRIGVLHINQKNYDKALEYCNEASEVNADVGDKQLAASIYNNMGLIYSEQGDLENGQTYFIQALSIAEEIKDKNEVQTAYHNIGNIYLLMGDYQQGLKYLIKSYEYAEQMGRVRGMEMSSYSMYELYSKTGDYKKALEMYETSLTMRDSIDSEESKREIIRQEYKYAYEKEALKDSVKNAEARKVLDAQIEAQDAKLKQEQIMRYSLFGGVLGLLFFGGFTYNRFRKSQAQKKTIEAQKLIVDEAHKEITDSISYAKRIQSAVLPPDKVVKEYLENSFILYKPKDIVAGDFYWLEQKNDCILFAAADCTGHGVPGAMVSVICNNGLNRSVREHGLTDPGKILDKTRDIVIEEFEKSEEEMKDGMDIALCSLKGLNLQYAGAHNPLWIIRDQEILETKADKQPIGKFEHSKSYATHSFDLKKGDSIYIFSDGYVDQFGGENGKKFMARNFKKLLISIQDRSMEEQKNLIDEAFESWKGSEQQIDDVCVVGVRV